jgi:autotransporter-associated beta strand protein
LRRIRQKRETECNRFMKLYLHKPIERFKPWIMKKQNSSTNVAGTTIALIVFLASNLIIIPSADAQNTWDGGGTDSNWGTADNWDDNLVPSFPVALIFGGSTRLDPVNNLAGPTTLTGLTFASGAGAFTLSGNAITLSGTITSDNTASNIINIDINRSGSNLKIGNGSSLELAGVISGTGGITRNSSGGGTLSLSNVNNSFTGSVNLGVPQVTEFVSVANAGVNSSLGASTGTASIITLANVSAQNPTLRYIGSSNSSTDRVVFLNGTTGSRTLDASGSGSVKFLGGVTSSGNGSKTFVLTGTSTAANEITSIPDDSGSNTNSLSKTGNGTWALSGTNTYTGTTTITAGTLQLGAGGTTGSLSSSSAITNNATLRFNRTNTITQGTDFSTAGISGNGTVVQAGSGSLILNAANTYTGATNVTAGILVIASAGSISNSSAVTVSGGAQFRYNSATARTGGITLNGAGAGSRATLSGTGPINVALTLDNVGDTLSPGNSPGIQLFGANQTWNSFTYVWETNNFTGTTAGTDFDQIAITGNLTLTGVALSYVLDITSLTGGNVAGDVPNFSEINRTWTILSTTAGITGFDATHWTLSTGNFTSSPTAAGAWSLGQTGNDLVLSYSAIPEPSTTALLLGGLCVVAILLRRRKAMPQPR